jgi:hypothetical protein
VRTFSTASIFSSLRTEEPASLIALDRAANVKLAPAYQAAVPIDQIVGSVEPMMCFDRRFRPTSELPRARFERIAADVRCGRGMDPVELYRCGDEYYVLDGHYRIAVARALGERRVWATITEVRMNQPGPPRTSSQGAWR